jgi:cation-transporting ATPase 13A1
MTTPPHNITVLRDSRWQSIKSDALLPGDIVSITRGNQNEDVVVPCDVLLLSGHCIVNEAMLSGESTPMMKESIELREGDDVLDMESADDKRHILFGGTKVLQHHGPTSTADSDSEMIMMSTISCIAPDGGCIGYVLRTGFGTTQGRLVRMSKASCCSVLVFYTVTRLPISLFILLKLLTRDLHNIYVVVHSADRASANNIESLFFILFLLIFAVAASYHVWTAGIAAGRKTSKLLLDCVIILTSVVPPELPMELSLAVNQSLVALSRVAIFCTEPFRIPFAGKTDICCFDKTGTLTADQLVVEGVAGIG